MNEARIDVALVQQKDIICRIINNGFDFEENWSYALQILESCLPVWGATGYAYKGIELSNLIKVYVNDTLFNIAPQAKKRIARLQAWKNKAIGLANRFHNC